MKRTIRERALAFLLTLVLLFTLVPATFAAEAGDGEETTPGEGETTPGSLTSVAMNRQNLPLVMGESSTLTVTMSWKPMRSTGQPETTPPSGSASRQVQTGCPLPLPL